MAKTASLAQQLAKEGKIEGLITASQLPARQTRHTGSLALDIELGGGFPQRGIVELYGKEASFKSTLCFMAAGACQRNGGAVAIADVEQRIEQQHSTMLRCGMSLDHDKLVVVKGEYAEQFMERCCAIIKANRVRMLIVDSIGMMVGQEWEERSLEDGQGRVGGISRAVNLFVRRLTSALAPKDPQDPTTYPNCTIILVNHAYESIGTYGGGLITTGGRAKNYAAVHRIQLTAGEPVSVKRQGKTVRIGKTVKFRIVKNSYMMETEGTFNVVRVECPGCGGDREKSLHCSVCSGQRSVLVVDENETLRRYLSSHNMLQATGNTWLFHDAEQVLTGTGSTYDLHCKKQGLSGFITNNQLLCCMEVFKVEQAKRVGFVPHTMIDVDTIVIRSKPYKLAEYNAAELPDDDEPEEEEDDAEEA